MREYEYKQIIVLLSNLISSQREPLEKINNILEEKNSIIKNLENKMDLLEKELSFSYKRIHELSNDIVKLDEALDIVGNKDKDKFNEKLAVKVTPV